MSAPEKRWALISNDEHLCVGCFGSEEEAVNFNADEGVLALAGGRVIYLRSPDEWASRFEEEE